MKIVSPFPLPTIVQRFGENAVSTYVQQGLKGHSGIDYQVQYGTPIKCVVDNSQCYSTMSKNNPNLMAYRAVYTIVDDIDCSYELSYGHCTDMYPTPGQTYNVGSIMGLVGNTGDVYQGGIAVTEAEKLAGSHKGTHLHFQIRKLQKQPVNIPLEPTRHYINDGFGILIFKGNYYYVPEWNNGYNGCVDPMQFIVDNFQTELQPSDRLFVLANQMMLTDPTQAKILLAVARLLKAFNS